MAPASQGSEAGSDWKATLPLEAGIQPGAASPLDGVLGDPQEDPAHRSEHSALALHHPSPRTSAEHCCQGSGGARELTAWRQEREAGGP